MDRQANECLTTLSLTVFTRRNIVADFLRANCDFSWKTALLRFWAPLGGLGTTYDVHLRLIGNCVVDFLLVLIEHFSLGATAEVLQMNIDWKSAILLQLGQLNPKFQVEGVAPTNYSSSQKTRLNDLSYGIKIWTDLSSALSQSTCLTDGQTDRILITRPFLHSMQHSINRLQ